MRSPSIVPGFNFDVYVVLDDFGKIGRCYREADEFDTVIRNLLTGQYNDPFRVVAFNTSEGWSRDVTGEIAREIEETSERKGEELSPGLAGWIETQLEIGARARLVSA